MPCLYFPPRRLPPGYVQRGIGRLFDIGGQAAIGTDRDVAQHLRKDFRGGAVRLRIFLHHFCIRMQRVCLHFQERRRAVRIASVPVYQQVILRIMPTGNQRLRFRPDLVRQAVVARQIHQHGTGRPAPLRCCTTLPPAPKRIANRFVYSFLYSLSIIHI